MSFGSLVRFAFLRSQSLLLNEIHSGFDLGKMKVLTGFSASSVSKTLLYRFSHFNQEVDKNKISRMR